jgi:hypothetical protein
LRVELRIIARRYNYRFVNAQNGESGLNDPNDLAEVRAWGFSEHPQRPKTSPSLAFSMSTFSVGIVAMALSEVLTRIQEVGVYTLLARYPERTKVAPPVEELSAVDS